jgi:adenylate kinase
MNKPRTVFFIGKPGCGKGTQAKLLAQKTGWDVLASGDQFRAIAAEENPVGKKVRHEIDLGLLMPPWFAMYIYLKSFFSVNEEDSIIFDGFNRKEEEAQLVVDSLTWLNRPFVAIHIQVSDDEIRRRLEGRKADQGREDDKYVETRLAEYEKYTLRSIALFESKGELLTINGEQTPEKVLEDIEAALHIL